MKLVTVMNKEEYAELLDFIDENNGWAYSYRRNHTPGIPFVKYVVASYDTRDFTIWSVTLLIGGRDIVFSHDNCNLINIKNYLKGEDAEYIVTRR